MISIDILTCIVVKVLLLLIVIKNCNREISDLEDVHLNFNDGDLYDNCICTLKSQRSGKLQIRDLFPRSQDCSTGIRFTTTSTGGTQEKTFNCTESIVENITLDTKGSLSIQLVRFRGGRNGSDDFYYCFMISKRGDLFLKLYLFFCFCFFLPLPEIRMTLEHIINLLSHLRYFMYNDHILYLINRCFFGGIILKDLSNKNKSTYEFIVCLFHMDFSH